MRRPRVRLRTMMTAVAFLALVLTVVVQSVRLREAQVREQQLRAEAEHHRVLAEARYRQARALLDGMSTGVAEQQIQPPVAAPKP